MSQSPDIVIVGGGIAGASLATVLAREGVDVLVLEKQTEYSDRVRGESMLGWGVVETKRLGLYDVLMNAGAHHTGQMVQYSPYTDPATSEASPIPIGLLVPEIPGSLNMQHRVACEVLAQAAADAGASVVRGVRSVAVTSNAKPEVSYATNGDRCDLSPRLVIGADGRASSVRRQVGIKLEKQAPPGFMAGLLIEEADISDRWDFLGIEDPLSMLCFVQGSGRARVYLSPPPYDLQRFAGPEGPARFIEDMALKCFPFADALRAARPAGPCATYPGDDTWTDRPFTDGVVLIGDAAGHNNPLVGQGLSLAMRDVRSIHELLIGNERWDAALFEDYGAERNERMRRVRFGANYMALLVWDFTPRGERRRRAFSEVQGADFNIVAPLLLNYTGPDDAPPELYEPAVMEQMASLG